MNTSTNGILLIKKHEGCLLRAYDDKRPNYIMRLGDVAQGTLTAGYGHTGSDVVVGMTVTQDMADAWLASDLRKFENCINNTVKVELSQDQFDALVDFTYNVGVGAFSTSTLLKKINAGAPQSDIAVQFRRWNRGNGQVLSALVKRREDEVALYAATIESPSFQPSTTPIYVTAPAVVTPAPLVDEHISMLTSKTVLIHAGTFVAAGASVTSQLVEPATTLRDSITGIPHMAWIVGGASALIAAAALFGFVHRALQIHVEAKS